MANFDRGVSYPISDEAVSDVSTASECAETSFNVDIRTRAVTKEKPTTHESACCKNVCLHNGKYEEIFGVTDSSQDCEDILRSRLKDVKSDYFIAFIVNKIKITFKAEPIQNQNTDVIVNSTNENLDIRGWGILNRNTVTFAIARAAGQVAKDSVRNDYPNGIEPGEVAVGEPGNLKCKKLFHVAMERFDRYRARTKLEVLKKSVETCLNRAETMGYTSIAFPALGTGNHRFPPERVAETMLECFVNHARQQTVSSLESIIVITGLISESPVNTAFDSQVTKRKLLDIEISRNDHLIREPKWLCPAYLHVTTSSKEDMDRIFGVLSNKSEVRKLNSYRSK